LSTDKTRWENIDRLLTRTERTRIEARAAATREVAAQRFKFPAPEHPAYRTFVNVPDVTMAVRVGAADLAPDIVVVEHPASGEPAVVMAVIVAIPEQVNEDEARERWAPLAAIPGATLFVFVPAGYGNEAKRLCAGAGVQPEGFRSYRNTPQGFEISDIGEAHSASRALFPGFARRHG
jgi:hypothetical protein